MDENQDELSQSNDSSHVSDQSTGSEQNQDTETNSEDHDDSDSDSGESSGELVEVGNRD